MESPFFKIVVSCIGFIYMQCFIIKAYLNRIRKIHKKLTLKKKTKQVSISGQVNRLFQKQEPFEGVSKVNLKIWMESGPLKIPRSHQIELRNNLALQIKELKFNENRINFYKKIETINGSFYQGQMLIHQSKQ